MTKRSRRKKVDSEVKTMEHQEASQLVLNDSPWEMDQYVYLFINYNNLRKYETQRGLESVLALFWNKLSMLGERPKKCSEGGFGVWIWVHVEMGAHLPLSKSMPTPEEVLYFYQVRSQPMRDHKDKVGFYRLQRYSKSVSYPTSSMKYTHDFRDYYFYTSGFQLRRVPTLSLDFNLANQSVTLQMGLLNKFLGSVKTQSDEIRQIAQGGGDGRKKN
uniref:Uncharacterized protein n=1 Tax=Cannabis sativa TaxID=3483 RepID=A0A803QG31_CANSA